MIDGWVAGVDVSGAQRPGACDWAKAKAAGVDFAFVKLSEGKDYIDAAAHEHIRNIAKAEIPVGVFHVGRPDNRFREGDNGREAGEREAKWAIACMKDRRVSKAIDLRPVIDLERYTDKGVLPSKRGEYVRALVAGIAEFAGSPPIIYAGNAYWKYQMPKELADELRAMGCPLWLAAYSKDPEPPAKETIKRWPWSVWQWSGGGKWAYAPQVDGLPKVVDANRYRGTLDEFQGLMLRS